MNVGDLLFHAVHGLCRIDKVMEKSPSGETSLCYALVPKARTKMKTRFVITAAGMEASGFHSPVSAKEADKILQYLKAGDSSDAAPKSASSVISQAQTWSLAQVILSLSFEKYEAKDQRKRQILERSVKGLIGELAYVFNTSLKETAAKIQTSLGRSSKINPLVLLALEHAGEEF